MPLFYLHIRCDAGLIKDEEGIEREGLAQATLEAVRGARSIMSDEVQAGHLRLDQAIDIHDAEGRQLSSVPFGDAVRITAPLRAQRS
jgi:hypothetical protein